MNQSGQDAPGTIKINDGDDVWIHVTEHHPTQSETVPLVRVYHVTHQDLIALRSIKNIRSWLQRESP